MAQDETSEASAPTEDNELKVQRVLISLCALCLEGKGDECHTPGCALCFHNSPGQPIHRELYEILPTSSLPTVEVIRDSIRTAMEFVAKQADQIPEGSQAFRPMTLAQFKEIGTPLAGALVLLDALQQMAEKAEAFDWIEANRADVNFRNETGYEWNIATESGEIDEGGETLIEAWRNARKTELELAAQQ